VLKKEGWIIVAVAVIASLVVTLSVSYFGAAWRAKHQSHASDTQKVFDRVVASNVIRCGYATWPPAMIKDAETGELSGINYDVMEAVGRELNLRIEWVKEVSFGNYLDGLNNGDYDVFCSTTWPDPAQIRLQSYARPYFFSPTFAYVRQDDDRFDHDLDSINSPEVVIAVLDGDSSSTSARIDYPMAKAYTLPTIAEADELFKAVANKKADVLFTDEGNFHSFDKDNLGVLRPVAGVPTARVYGEFMAVKYGENELRDMINVALTGLINSGKITDIMQRYEGHSYLLPDPDFNRLKTYMPKVETPK
jgi:ABC-type amino acid transport substrate-binding protein